mgnify:CR=1 FL=1
MVERFQLNAYILENQKDWDLYLPYIIMAYRSTVHESTAFSPNILMLGRETTTSLDLMYEMPSEMKSIPAFQWAWILCKRMEKAHTVVKLNMHARKVS